MRAFVKRYQNLVFALCYRILSHQEDAEDVAQEVFLRAFRGFKGWDMTRPMKPWLLAIATNRCRTFLQKRARRPIMTDYAVEAPAATTEKLDLAEELQAGLEGLRTEYRTCFVLYYQQELPLAEISRVMECPTGTIKTWLHRARRDLADYLRKRGFGPETHYELQRV